MISKLVTPGDLLNTVGHKFTLVHGATVSLFFFGQDKHKGQGTSGGYFYLVFIYFLYFVLHYYTPFLFPSLSLLLNDIYTPSYPGK